MKIALLARGFHYLQRDRYGYALNGLDHFASFQQKFLAPLQRDHEVRVYLATYPSPVWPEIERLYAPQQSLLLDPKKNQQVDTFLAALEMIAADFPEADRIICTRFDLEYLLPIDQWRIWGEQPGIYFPWREYEHLWNLDQRVGDFFHIIDRAFLAHFISALASHNGRNHIHELYRRIKESVPDVFFIEDGFYDSNTYFSNPECHNPLYRIGNRPRICIHQPIMSDSYFKMMAIIYSERVISVHLSFWYNSRRWWKAKKITSLVKESYYFALTWIGIVYDFIFGIAKKILRIKGLKPNMSFRTAR